MITGVHATLFAQDAEAARAFFRDVLELASVDAGGGWLAWRARSPRAGAIPSLR